MAASPLRDQVIKDAQSMPDLIAKAKVLDPDLATQLTSKALIASKTVWGNAAVLVVSWLVTRYGIGWSADTCALIAGLLVMAATAVFRSITTQPIGGVLTSGGNNA
jgi:hypothetical protein